MTRVGRASRDPFAPENLADPYPCYASLRAEVDDFVDLPAIGMQVVSRYDVVRGVLRDHELYRSGDGVGVLPANPAARGVFIESDPPAHTRVRRAVAKLVTPRAIAELREIVIATADRLIADAVSAGEVDVMEAIARPLPRLVIGDWLGIEVPEEATGWADAQFRVFGGESFITDEVMARLGEMVMWMFSGAFNAPKPGSIGEAVMHGEASRSLEELERPNAMLSLVIAGLDTTVHMVGNGIAALAAHGEQWDALRGDPDGLAPGVTEEVLRFDSPIRFFVRRPPDGSPVIVLLAAANRDDAHFPEADEFRIDRAPNDHVAFGSGIHQCLGAPLARLEGEAVFSALAKRASAITVLEGASRSDSPTIRGYDTLPVRFDV